MISEDNVSVYIYVYHLNSMLYIIYIKTGYAEFYGMTINYATFLTIRNNYIHSNGNNGTHFDCFKLYNYISIIVVTLLSPNIYIYMYMYILYTYRNNIHFHR